MGAKREEVNNIIKKLPIKLPCVLHNKVEAYFQRHPEEVEHIDEYVAMYDVIENIDGRFFVISEIDYDRTKAMNFYFEEVLGVRLSNRQYLGRTVEVNDDAVIYNLRHSQSRFYYFMYLPFKNKKGKRVWREFRVSDAFSTDKYIAAARYVFRSLTDATQDELRELGKLVYKENLFDLTFRRMVMHLRTKRLISEKLEKWSGYRLLDRTFSRV
jgi:hypothetical protein